MFRRIINLIRGFFSMFIGGLERQNPEALLEIEKENLRNEIAKYNQGLAAHAGLCEKLVGQLKKLETEENDLRAKTAAHLRAGNREAAGQYALRLQTISKEREEIHQQSDGAEKTYQDLIRARDVAVKAATDKIEALKFGLSDLKVKKATAELNEMASGMIGQIGGAGETLDRLSGIVEEERTKAAGRARVSRDSLDTSGIAVKESEQKAMADQALADFAAKEGIALEPTTPPAATAPAPAVEPAVKSMGPASQ